MDRTQHLDWCKKRALEYVDNGDVRNAFASISSDMQKHSETQNHPAITLGLMLFMGGHLETPEAMGNYIQGIN